MESALAKLLIRRGAAASSLGLTVGPTKAYFGLMPAYVPSPASLGAKVVTVFGENHTKQLPSHLATILLLDPETGSLIALMDGRYITEARTAAVSAVSARFLARANAGRLAIIGSGVQARSHLEALQHVRQLTDVRIWSPRPQSRRQFVDDMSPHVPVPIVAADSAEAAVRDADLIVLATSSKTPVVERVPGSAAVSRHVRRHRPVSEDGAGARAAEPAVCRFQGCRARESGDVVMNTPKGFRRPPCARIGELVPAASPDGRAMRT